MTTSIASRLAFLRAERSAAIRRREYLVVNSINAEIDHLVSLLASGVRAIAA